METVVAEVDTAAAVPLLRRAVLEAAEGQPRSFITALNPPRRTLHSFIHPLIASTLADIWQAWPAASLLWLAGFAYAVKNLWATR